MLLFHFVRFGNTPLRDAELANHTEICRYLKEYVKAPDRSKLKLEFCNRLLRAIESADEVTATKVLKVARHCGHLQEICVAPGRHKSEWMLALNKRDPDYPKYKTMSEEQSIVITELIAKNQKGTIKTMIDLGFVPEKSCATLSINMCIKEQKYDIMELLLQAGACVNHVDDRMRTPLFAAIELKDALSIQMLLNHEADPNQKDKHTCTPLIYLLQFWNEPEETRESKVFGILQLLLWNKADVNATDGVNFSALHYASGNQILRPGFAITDAERSRIVQLLIQHKAVVDLQGNDGSTPLHIASSSGNTLVVDTLLAAGARIDVTNALNFTPAEIAPAGSKIREALEKQRDTQRHPPNPEALEKQRDTQRHPPNPEALEKQRDTQGHPPNPEALEKQRDTQRHPPNPETLEKQRDTQGHPPNPEALEKQRDTQGHPPNPEALEKQRDTQRHPPNPETLEKQRDTQGHPPNPEVQVQPTNTRQKTCVTPPEDGQEKLQKKQKTQKREPMEHSEIPTVLITCDTGSGVARVSSAGGQCLERRPPPPPFGKSCIRPWGKKSTSKKNSSARKSRDPSGRSVGPLKARSP